MILICGLGRCGSSLLMQILDAAGVRCSGVTPSFEEPRLGRNMRISWDWLPEYNDGALKVLWPARYGLPPLHSATVVWLDRDPKQQAKSFVLKFARKILKDRTATRREVPRIRRILIKQRQENLHAAYEAAYGDVLMMRYELVKSNPEPQIKRLLDHCGLEGDPAELVKVLRNRDSACRAKVLEHELVKERKEQPWLNVPK